MRHQNQNEASSRWFFWVRHPNHHKEIIKNSSASWNRNDVCWLGLFRPQQWVSTTQRVLHCQFSNASYVSIRWQYPSSQKAKQPVGGKSLELPKTTIPIGSFANFGSYVFLRRNTASDEITSVLLLCKKALKTFPLLCKAKKSSAEETWRKSITRMLFLGDFVLDHWLVGVQVFPWLHELLYLCGWYPAHPISSPFDPTTSAAPCSPLGYSAKQE